MTSRKRGRQELEADNNNASSSHAPSVLDRIRNMWQFANLMQYLFIFGKVVRVDENIGIEDLETELLKPGGSDILSEIGLALLKFISSHKGLTREMFDEYTRRQYQTRAPKRNPFGDAETPASFSDFDAVTKIRVLYQLAQWTMVYSDRIRERMEGQKDHEQAYWRVEPTGWDADERTYFLLDDNRLYRRTDPEPPPPPAPKPKKNSKKAKALARAEKRRKLAGGDAADATNGGEADGATSAPAIEDDDFGGFKWECLAITLDEYHTFMESIQRSKDPNEQVLYGRLRDEILPVVEKAEEEQRRKMAKKEKELRNMEKLATAKRSSRIASKTEKQKEEAEAAEAERKRLAELAMARREQERLNKLERERDSRIMTREQRLKEREMRRILHEEELANLSEDNKKLAEGEGRMSERHLKAEMEKRKKALEELKQDGDWFFDCSGCGVHGENLDDGTSIIACEKCNVWQHLGCLGISKTQAEQKDFHFICGLCKRREEDREKSARNPIKLDFRKLGSSMSPPLDKTAKPDGGHGSIKKRKNSEEHGAESQKKAKQTIEAVVVPKGEVNGLGSTVEGPNGAAGQQRPLHPPLHTWTPAFANGYPAASAAQNSNMPPSANGITSTSQVAHPNGMLAGDGHSSVHQSVGDRNSSKGLDRRERAQSPEKHTDTIPQSRSNSPLPPLTESVVPNGIVPGPAEAPRFGGSPPGSPKKASSSGAVSQPADGAAAHLTFTPSAPSGNPPLNGVLPSAAGAAASPALTQSPRTQLSPSSVSKAAIYNSPAVTNGAGGAAPAAAAAAVLPPASSGVSPIKRSPAPLPAPRLCSNGPMPSSDDGPAAGGVGAGVGAGGGGGVSFAHETPVLPPAPTLSPSPARVDLTPPRKKLTPAAAPPPLSPSATAQSSSVIAGTHFNGHGAAQ